RSSGLQSVEPKRRVVHRGSRRLSLDYEYHILKIRKEEYLHMPITVFYEQLIQRCEIQKDHVSYATINRLLINHKLAGQHHMSFYPERERKRFSHDKVNVLWQADLSHGPYIRMEGKMKNR